MALAGLTAQVHRSTFRKLSTMVATGSTPAVPPLSPYGTLQGSLFCYHNNLAAFESIAPDHPTDQPLPSKKCILIGGLSDGLMPTPYTQDLERECHKAGWSFVNPILSSSYLGASFSLSVCVCLCVRLSNFCDISIIALVYNG